MGWLVRHSLEPTNPFKTHLGKTPSLTIIDIHLTCDIWCIIGSFINQTKLFFAKYLWSDRPAVSQIFQKIFETNFYKYSTNISQIFPQHTVTGGTAPLPNISSRGGRSFHKTRRTSWSRSCNLIMNYYNIIMILIFEWSCTCNWTTNDKWKIHWISSENPLKIQWRLKYYTVSADYKKVTR